MTKICVVFFPLFWLQSYLSGSSLRMSAQPHPHHISAGHTLYLMAFGAERAAEWIIPDRPSVHTKPRNRISFTFYPTAIPYLHTFAPLWRLKMFSLIVSILLHEYFRVKSRIWSETLQQKCSHRTETNRRGFDAYDNQSVAYRIALVWCGQKPCSLLRPIRSCSYPV